MRSLFVLVVFLTQSGEHFHVDGGDGGRRKGDTLCPLLVNYLPL